MRFVVSYSNEFVVSVYEDNYLIAYNIEPFPNSFSSVNSYMCYSFEFSIIDNR